MREGRLRIGELCAGYGGLSLAGGTSCQDLSIAGRRADMAEGTRSGLWAAMRVAIATLGPFHGYRCAIDDQLDDAIAVLDAFHVVKLGTAAVDEVRRRVQQDIHGHRGRRVAEMILASFPSCPIPEIARLGRTLNRWRDAFLGYFTTGGANNGGTEAINGLIELHRRVARGFRNLDNYRLRMLLTGDGLRL